jgi:hypothetical protein
MDPIKCSQNTQQNWDEETTDEMLYDENAMSKALDAIYDKTKDHTLFKNIYQIAAAKMISMDNEIGLAVCFSYDFFKYFYECFESYKKNPNEFTESSQYYQTMIHVLT